MMRALLALALLSSTAFAGKPTAKAAKAAFVKWAKLSSDKTADKVAGLMTPFRIVAYKDGDEKTCDLTVTDRAKLGEAYKCYVDANVNDIELKPYTKKLLASLGQLSEYKGEIEKLAKDAQLFGKLEHGEGVSVFTIVAIGLDGKEPRLEAVYAWSVYH